MATLRDLIAWTGLVILLKLDSNRWYFAYMTLKIDGWPWETMGTFSMLFQALCIISWPLVNSKSWKRQIWVKIRDFFGPCDLEIWQMTFKTNRVLLWFFNLCASFHNHRRIQTRVIVRKRQILVQNGYLLPPVTFKFDGWHWKIIGHLFYVTSSFLHYLMTIYEFKHELQSGYTQFRP